MADFSKRELLFGLTNIESYLDLSAQDLEFGFNETRRDRILRTYVRNVYHYHLNEIYSALKVSVTQLVDTAMNTLIEILIEIMLHRMNTLIGSGHHVIRWDQEMLPWNY